MPRVDALQPDMHRFDARILRDNVVHVPLVRLFGMRRTPDGRARAEIAFGQIIANRPQIRRPAVQIADLQHRPADDEQIAFRELHRFGNRLEIQQQLASQRPEIEGVVFIIDFRRLAGEAQVAHDEKLHPRPLMHVQQPTHQGENTRQQRHDNPIQVIAHSVKFALLNQPMFGSQQLFHHSLSFFELEKSWNLTGSPFPKRRTATFIIC